MNNHSFSRLLIALLMFFVLAAHAQANNKQSQPFVVSGVVINSGSAALIDRFVQHLSTKTGYALHPVFVDTYAELSKIMRNNPKALAWTCGAPFVEDHIKDGQQLISVPLFLQKPEYRSFVIARKNRPEKSLQDFKGKIFTYSDLRSNSGYFSPSIELKNRGINLQDHFRLLIRAGNHERSIQAVVNGLADVAAVDEYVWVEFMKRNPKIEKRLTILEKNGPYPFTPLVAGKSVSQKTIHDFQNVLLKFNQSSEGKAMLQEFGLDGFVTKKIAFFNPIKNMLEKLEQN